MSLNTLPFQYALRGNRIADTSNPDDSARIHEQRDRDLEDYLGQLDARIGSISGVPVARRIDTSAPLTGGGDLSVNRTLAVSDFTTAARGTVPASGGGTANYLRADGLWTPPPGGLDIATADARYVNIPGDTMTGDLNIAAPAQLAFGSTLGQKVNLYGGGYVEGVQTQTLYGRSGLNFAWYKGGVHSDTALDPGAGGVEMMSLQPTGLLVGKGLNTVRPLAIYGDGSGNVYISFFDSAGVQRHYIGSLGTSTMVIQNLVSGGPINVRTNSADGGDIALSPRNVETMRATSAGDVLVGKTATDLTVVGAELKGPIGRLYTTTDTATALNVVCNINNAAANNVWISFRRSNTEIGRIRVLTTTNTNFDAGPSGTFTSTSDRRLKRIIGPVIGASERVRQLNPVHFAWKHDDTTHDGFVADELQQVVPDAVTGEPDAVDENGQIVPQSADNSQLVPLLTAALQDALERISILEHRIERLEAA